MKNLSTISPSVSTSRKSVNPLAPLTKHLSSYGFIKLNAGIAFKLKVGNRLFNLITFNDTRIVDGILVGTLVFNNYTKVNVLKGMTKATIKGMPAVYGVNVAQVVELLKLNGI